MSRIRVLVIEDEPIIAAKIEMALTNIDFKIAGIAYTKDQALHLISTAYPDAALIDINLEGAQEGLEIGKIIDEKYKIPFVYLTAHADRMTLAQAKLTNPAGYIVKPFEEEDLLVNLELAMHRYASLKSDLANAIDFNAISESTGVVFSEREIDVIQQIYQGKTNQQMAEDLSISVNTVKSHILKIYQKLDVHSRSQLLAALRQ